VKQARWFLGLLTLVVLLSACQGGPPGAQMVEGAPTPAGLAGTPTPLPELPAGRVILMDGELKAASPSLKLTFAGNVNAELLTLNVTIGQRVERGDLIAALDDGDLQQAIVDAQLTLDRATEDRDKAQSDAEEQYQRQVEDAEEKYEREVLDAQRSLESAQAALERAKMQPPTTSVAEAKANLAKALDQQAQAHDEYKKALDRPWEPQRIRDSLYKDWQERIVERELAELRLQDAQIALDVYYLDLAQKQKDVADAEEDLARVTKDTVEREDILSYERAVEDAERVLSDTEEALEDARLYAPFDGLVVSIDVNVGSEVSSGTPIVTLIDLEHLYFVTENLSERHVAQIGPGQEANITLRAYPDTVLTGQVDSVIPQEQVAGAEARFAAYIRPDETELDLLPGMTGRVEVVTEEE
jgi:multidrug resistance efflux pump